MKTFLQLITTFFSTQIIYRIQHCNIQAFYKGHCSKTNIDYVAVSEHSSNITLQFNAFYEREFLDSESLQGGIRMSAKPSV